MSDIAFADLSVRLAKTLLLYSGARKQSGAKKRLSLSQRELADMVGATRESVNRQLRQWQRRGIVSLSAGWLVIELPAALAELAEAI